MREAPLSTTSPLLSLTGFPSPAENFREERLDLNRLVAPHPQATFFMRAGGEALREDGIRNGDILVVDRALPLSDNCLVVAAWEGDLVIRRVRRQRGRLCLMPADERLDSLDPAEADQQASPVIWGVITYVLHELRPSACR